MDWLTSFAHAAAWVVGLTLLFAAIGVYATIRWIISLFIKGEQEVEAGVQGVERMVTRK